MCGEMTGMRPVIAKVGKFVFPLTSILSPKGRGGSLRDYNPISFFGSF